MRGIGHVERKHRDALLFCEIGAVFVSPYNDAQVVGGQGTIAIELMRALDRIDVVYVSIGGGGLIGGIAGWLKAKRPAIRIVGVQPEIRAEGIVHWTLGSAWFDGWVPQPYDDLWLAERDKGY